MSARTVVLAAFVLLAGTVGARADPDVEPLRLFTDFDDDDDDGVPDAAAPQPSARALEQVHWLPVRGPIQVQGDAVRVVTSRDRRGLQGLRAGRSEVRAGERSLQVHVVEVRALDGRDAAVDLARSHASITRSLPAFLASGSEPDGDALRWLFIGAPDALPERAKLVSTRPDGSPLDELPQVDLDPAPCPPNTAGELVCRSSPPIRATSDEIDRQHPESRGRSLRAEVGGRITVLVDGRQAARIRVGGPRDSALGPLARYRAKLRVRVLRLAPGGAPALGSNAEEARRVIESEIDTASQLWGQCGIHFGTGKELDIAVVDPPPAHLLSVGCNFGLPASGGELRFSVGKRKFSLRTSPGEMPLSVASRIAEALNRANLSARVSPNPRISAGVLGSVDVLVRGPNGAPVAFEADEGRPLSSDATLGVCLGSVDLRDGLSHFGDYDASAGTLEERALIKAFDDGDPSTIEVFVVPAFAESTRIGESFIYADGASIRNTVIVDRAAIRAGARSYALAHELGHVLLEMPGHPDDFGVDQPSALMDADAADPTIFGPRRLSVAECERAIRQSGPNAPVPLLTPWPLYRARP